jgi:hypothetical protein
LSFFNISSGANNKPKPTAIPHTESDQLLFIAIDENKDPKIITTPSEVVIKLFHIFVTGLLSSRDFRTFFFFTNFVWF